MVDLLTTRDAEKLVVEVERGVFSALLLDAMAAHDLHGLVNRPHTDNFLEATRLEAGHQIDRFGAAHDRDKSAENWFWLVGYLAGKCLHAVVTGNKAKALHHTISTAAALLNWHEAITKDTTGSGRGEDKDIAPEYPSGASSVALPGATVGIPVVNLSPSSYSGR